MPCQLARRLTAGLLMLGLAACGGAAHTSSSASRPAFVSTPSSSSSSPTVTSTTSSPPPPRPHPKPHAPFAVGVRVVTFVDHSRTVSIPGEGTVPRTLVTIIRYPALGRAGTGDAPGARPARVAGPFPLIVFGHGFAVTPGIYARLLRAWARAGFVVAAPVFPLENANAPGGPNESDLINQPSDMSFVITSLIAATRARRGFLSGLVVPREIVVSGQSDGGDTALSAAYNSRFKDPRIGAVVILSGMEMPGVGGYDFPAPNPPLLATQGTADTINPPGFTSAFFAAAAPPRYLLWLLGAPHLPPYTYEQPQLGIVERVTIAFLDHFLKHRHGALARMAAAAGSVPGVARMVLDPPLR